MECFYTGTLGKVGPEKIKVIFKARVQKNHVISCKKRFQCVVFRKIGQTIGCDLNRCGLKTNGKASTFTLSWTVFKYSSNFHMTPTHQVRPCQLGSASFDPSQRKQKQENSNLLLVRMQSGAQQYPNVVLVVVMHIGAKKKRTPAISHRTSGRSAAANGNGKHIHPSIQ